MRRLLAGNDLRAVILRGASGSFALNVTWAFLGFFSHVILANAMGQTHYGHYAYVFSWLMIIGLFVVVGLDKSALRFISVYRSQERWNDYRGLLQFSHRLVGVISAATAGLGAAVVWALRDRMAPDLVMTFWWACLLLPLLAVATLRQGMVQALKFPVRAQIGLMICRPALLIGGATALWVGLDRPLAAWHGMAIYAAAVACAYALNSYTYRRTVPAEVQSALPQQHAREWFDMALPMVMMAGMTMIMRQTAIIIVGAQLPSEDTALFAAATRLVNLVSFGLVAVNTISAPVFAELHAKGDRRELQRILRVSAWAIAGLGVPVTIVVIVFGSFLLRMFGAGFTDAYPVLVILIGGQVVNILCGSVGYLLTMSGHQLPAPTVVSLVAALNLVLCWVLVGQFGIVGGAAATAISNVVWNLILLAIVARKLQLNPTVFRLRTRNGR
jgi:O-antigen/teichoic acid export membrane protein